MTTKHKQNVAAVDIGSASIGLLIASNITGPFNEWNIVATKNIETKLGEELPKFSNNKIEECRLAFVEMKNLIDSNNAKLVRIVATEAMRQSENAEIVGNLAENILNQKVEIITQKEESSLTYTGAFDGGDTVVCDIGGASCEVIYRNKPFLLDIGATTITKRYSLNDNPVDIVNLSNLMGEIKDDFNLAKTKLNFNNSAKIICVGGGVTTLAMMNLGINNFDVEKLNNYVMERSDAEEWFRILSTETVSQRGEHIGCSIGRASVIFGSSALLAGLMRGFDVPNIELSLANILVGVIKTSQLG